jgi:hypothetical protein
MPDKDRRPDSPEAPPIGVTTQASSHTERIEQPRYASFNDHRQQLGRLGDPQDDSFQQSAGYPPQPQYPFRQHLQGLSMRAKIGFTVAAGIVLLIIASIIIALTASSRDQWSYDLGSLYGDDALRTEQSGVHDQMACSDMLYAAELPPPMGAEKSGHTIGTDDFMAGCLDSLHKLGG